MYVKLFAQILDSSIWLESGDTRIVWITLLAAMDADGFARFAAVENLARRANVALEAAEIAVQTLEAPDPRSSDPDNEGRRIERVPGGWLILNAVKYRAIGSEINRRERTRERVAQWRKNQSGNADVTPRNDDVTKSNAMKKKKKKQRQTEKQKHTASDSNGSSEFHGVGLLAAQGAAIAPKPAPGKTPDPVFELFADRYKTAYEGIPYQSRTGDFVQLAKLRKTLGEDFPIDSWAVAVGNYLATPQRAHTLADLAVNYATFRRAPLDEFARPVDTRLGKTSRHNLALLQQIRNEERET